jgi:prepilin peptidase CpaA
VASVKSLLDLSTIVAILLAVYSDIAARTIPNSISIIVALIGLVIRTAAGPEALLASAIAAAVLFLFLALLHARGLLGGGDVKLMTAIAIGLSVPAIGQFLIVTMMAGGVLALLYLILRWTLGKRLPSAPPARGTSLWHRILAAEHWRIARHGSLPYGVAIACGGIWVIAQAFGH